MINSTLKKAGLILLLLFSLTTNQFYAQEVEPNNTVATGSPMPLNGSSSGNLSAGDGTDYHKVILDNNGTLSASAEIPAGLTARIYIYNKNGSQLAIGNSVSGPGTSTVERSCLAQDDVYVLVLRSSGEGDYTLSNSLSSPSLAEDAEPNQAIAQAQVFLAPGDNVTGHLGYNGVGISDPTDYYGLIAGDDGNVSITAQVDESLTARLYLYYKNGAQIGVSPAGSGELIATASCLANDTIYALVFLNAGCGSYDMTFTVDTPPNHDQDVEPNNLIATTNVFLEPNESVQGRLGYVGVGISDVHDYYGLIAGDDGNITITAQIDETLTARLYLYYKNGAQIGVSPAGSGELTATATCIANDTIYALVFHNSGCGSYDMTFTVDTPPNHDQDVEPNNLIATTNVFLDPNESVQGRLGYVGVGISDSHDYYGLIAGDDGNITITAQIDETLTARLYLYYKNGAQIGVSPAGSGELTATATCIANDTIYALVFHNSGCGSYDMTFTVDTPPNHDQDIEPNNTIGTTNVFLDPNESVQGRLGYVGVGISDSHDYYGLIAGDDGNITITAQIDETLTARLYLYYKNGAQIGVSPAGSGELTATATCVANDSIYALVFHNSGCGSYDMIFTHDPPTYANDVEPNGTTATANPMANGEAVEGHLGYNGVGISDPGDYYSFEVVQADFELNAKITMSETLAGRIYLYNSVGSQLDVTPALSGTFELDYTITTAGTYYLLVFRNSGCGSYKLGDLCSLYPTVEASPPGPILKCPDEPIILSATPGLTTYAWYNGADIVGNLQTYNAASSGDYTVIGYDINGCPDTSNVVIISALNCDDGNACTIDSCVDGECVYTPVDCDDGNACTTDSCDPATGCVNIDIVCDDGNECTLDSCDPATGCVFTDVDCDDSDACTTDTCVDGTCLNTPVDCDDGDPSTEDSCVDGECQNVITECNDNDACTTDTLDPSSGECVYTDLDCDDGNACTTDACDPATGCVYTDVVCDDGNVCTVDSCDPATGCVFTDVDCDDSDACTTDSCVDGTCVNTPVDCDDGDPSTEDFCEDGECQNVITECNDNDACTTDTLDPSSGECVYTDVDCDDGDACTVDSCDPAIGCINTPIECFDGIACTIDSCEEGICTFTIDSSSDAVCDDGIPCTLDECTPAGCVHTPVDDFCDDGSACTIDVCDVATGCVYIDINCDDGDLCTIDSCDPLIGCVNTAIVCDDGNACTTEVCVEGECLATPIECIGDVCDTAVPVFCGDVVDGSTVDATSEPAFDCGASNSGGGVWYSIFGTGQDVTASTCAFADYDTQIGLFTGTCDALVCAAANDDFCGLQSSLTFSTAVGVEYFIYVTGFSSNTGNFTLTITCEEDCPAPTNDEATGALPNTPDRLWGVPGWDTFDVGCATLSAQACDAGTPTSDSWYSFVAQAENQGILARANPADPNAANVDMAVEVFDASLTPLAGTTGGSCAESRSCFNNAGAGEIERCVPGGLTIGDTYYYRVYDAAGAATGTSLLVDTKVKTYASHTIVAGCDLGGASTANFWTIEDPVNLYNIPPVPVFNVRMVAKDLSGAIVAMTSAKNPAAPGGLTYSLAEFSPSLADGNYTIHAQNEVKMMANGCVSAYWSQCGPGCTLTVGPPAVEDTGVALSGMDANWSFTAYPNPNEGDQVYISMDKVTDVNQMITVEVFDMYGKKVHFEQFASAGNQVNRIITFDENLSSGIYFINLSVNESIMTEKLIIK